MDTLEPYSTNLKTYAVSDCYTLLNLGPAAEDRGFTLSLGIWPNDDSHYAAEKEALQTYLPQLSVSTISDFTVGSELLYRDDMSASDLADRINDIKDFISNIQDKDGNSYSSVPVGFVDSWNVLVDGVSYPAIQAADFVFANAFSYWQGQTQLNATFSFFDDIMQALQTIQGIKGSTDIKFAVGETGWPSSGTNFESSQPSVSNARAFWQDAICAMRGWGVDTYVFEAFDEDWKPDSSGTSDVEKHWGVWDSGRTLKYSLDCDFSS